MGHKNRVLTLGLAAVCLYAALARADGDADNQDAAQKTQELLNNPKKLQKLATENADTKKVMDSTNALTSNNEEQTNQIFALAGDIFPFIVKETNGDPEKIKVLLKNASQNPEAFASSLPPEDQKRISELAKQIQSNKAMP